MLTDFFGAHCRAVQRLQAHVAHADLVADCGHVALLLAMGFTCSVTFESLKRDHSTRANREAVATVRFRAHRMGYCFFQRHPKGLGVLLELLQLRAGQK
ncbi:hypothetical protein ABB26_10080 [Stenotrophomonas humi]|uniref:Uncharacterized protein n=1 Tax=Stenotrophomonas humi TaxID=405444 RepID=A0A0R0C1X2_9GAMM|nr:hypothetical protein ABB26_10080 [Stenotrophomonas humi]